MVLIILYSSVWHTKSRMYGRAPRVLILEPGNILKSHNPELGSMSSGDWNGGQRVQVRYLSTIIRWVTRSQFDWPLAGVLHQKCRILAPEFKSGPRLLFLRGNSWSGPVWLVTPRVIWMLPWASSECRAATEQEAFSEMDLMMEHLLNMANNCNSTFPKSKSKDWCSKYRSIESIEQLNTVMFYITFYQMVSEVQWFALQHGPFQVDGVHRSSIHQLPKLWIIDSRLGWVSR